MSIEVIVNLIAATTTTTGLTVHSEVDTRTYTKASRCRTKRWHNSTFRGMNFMESGITLSISPGNIWTFVSIAMQASQGEIVDNSGAAMLARNDMIDVKG
jgi:hypothetical protein